MACVDDRFGVIHYDTAQSAALLVGVDRDPFDVAGAEGNAAVVQSSGHDGGEPYEGLTVGEGHVHALHGVEPIVGPETGPERVAPGLQCPHPSAMVPCPHAVE
jgi:hypothetical protein